MKRNEHTDLCPSSSFRLSLHSKVKNRNLYLATFVSVLGPMSFGFVLGYSSPAIPELTSISDPRLRLDANQASWFGVGCYHITWLKAELLLEDVFSTYQQFYVTTCCPYTSHWIHMGSKHGKSIKKHQKNSNSTRRLM